MAEVFRCDSATAQLGLTFCMIGLAAGQVAFGPASDKYGRKPVLVFSLVIFVAASVACCISTSVVTFTGARLLQGIGGAGGIVLSRSIAADMYSGKELAKLIAILSAINNLAPVAAPVIGGGVAHIGDWRSIFIILLILGVILLGMCIPLKESLRPEHRMTENLAESIKGYREVLRIKGFTPYSLIYAMAMATLFAYISATPFIIQNLFGFSELQFSLVFADNAIALAVGSALSLRFKTMRKAVAYGSIISGTMALAGAATAITGIENFIMYEIPTFVMLFGTGLVLTGSTSEAMNIGRNRAGAASAVIGGIGYVAGGLISPLASYGNICVTSFTLCAIFMTGAAIITLGKTQKAE